MAEIHSSLHCVPALSEADITAAPFAVPPTLTLDGHRFSMYQVRADALSTFEMAYRARRGDASATAVLTAFRVTIRDADGRPYWPMEASRPAVVE